jgi:hypothetical protein
MQGPAACSQVISYPKHEMNGTAKASPECEFNTEVLEESQQLSVLGCVVQFLRSRDVGQVFAEFGFVVERDLQGELQGQDIVVPLGEFQGFVERGLLEGTIEWCGNSDFFFSPVGLELKFKLCNDMDLHFSSPDMPLLLELSSVLIALGVKVYNSGRLVEFDGKQ